MSNPSSTASSTHVPYTQILDDQVKSVFSTTAYTQLSAATTKYNTSNGLYLIDAFIPSNSNLQNVLFLREDGGVYAIALDGEKYISQATSLSDAKKRAGDIVLYRYLQNKANAAVGFPIDLSQTLNTFFTDNRDWLIYKYVQLNSNQELFNFDFINNDNDALKVLQDLASYAYINTRYKRIQTYQEAIFENKNKYDVADKKAFGSNYGTKSLFNGLASQFPYPFTSVVSKTDTTSGSSGYYSQLDTVKVENPFGDNDQSVKGLDFADPYGANGIYKKLHTDIAAYVNNKKISPLTSNFEGFKYSQYIFTDDFFINQAILAVGNDGNLLSDLVKKNVLLQSGIKEKFNLSSFDYIIPELYNVNSYKFNNAEANTYINNALSNFYFNSVFDNSKTKWVNLKETQDINYALPTTTTPVTPTPTPTPSQPAPPTTQDVKLPTISYSALNQYRKEMWINENIKMKATEMDSYINFLTLLSTIDYLMQDNGKNFLSQLSTKLSTADSRLSFLVWEANIDTKNQSNAASIATPKDLLYGTDASGNLVYTNVNNSQASTYYPLNSSSSVVGEKNSAYVNDTYSANYYKNISSLISFQGIQTNSTSQNITEHLKSSLFTNAKDKTGLLYGFADSREKLVTIVRNYSNSQITSLATTLQKLFSIDVSNVTSATNLNQMQNSLVSIINDTNAIPDSAFQPKAGYAEKDLYTEQSDEISGYKYGSYVIQLNENNLASASGFLDYLKSIFNKYDPSSSNSTSVGSTNAKGEEQANDLFWNLVVQIAADTNVQNSAISSITSANKVTVYDVRLNNQLGSRWVSNYKDQSS